MCPSSQPPVRLLPSRRRGVISGSFVPEIRRLLLAALTPIPAVLGISGLLGLPSVGVAQESRAGEGTPDGLPTAPLVEEVSFVGTSPFGADDLRAAIMTRPTRCRTLLFQPFCWITEGGFFQERERLNWEELPQDELRIQVYHWIRGYREAEATARVLPAGERVEIRFEVDAGRPTRLASLEVVQDTVLLSSQDLARANLPSPGEPLDMLRLRAAAVRIGGVLRERGYANAVIEDTVDVASEVERNGAHLADVRVRVRPGRLVTVDSIRIEGNDDVTERTIRRSLGLEPGTVYRESDLEEARRRLYRSNLFRQSLVTTVGAAPELTEAIGDASDVDSGVAGAGGIEPGGPAPQPGDTTRTVLVVVREAPFDEVGLGIGVTTLEFVQAQGSYSRHNLFGGARRLDLSATVGNLLAPALHDRGVFQDAIPEGVVGNVGSAFLDPTWRFAVDFTQPWLGSADNSLGLGVSLRRRAVPGVVVERSLGGNLTLSRRLTRDLTASAGYRFERTRTDAGGVYFCVNFGICAASTIDALQQSHQLSPLSFTLTWERLDDAVDPRRGYSAEVRAEHASAATLSEYRYNAANADGAYYRPVGPGVLALRARAGWIRSGGGTHSALGVADEGTSILHPRTRLYSGGSRSVRGYSESQLGPRILTVPSRRLTEAPDHAEPPCTVESVADRTCDPNAIDSDAFQPRPLGGNELLEGTVEYRYPITEAFGVAAFVDAGYVGDFELNIPTGARTALTPGAGVRYLSPAGIIRVDLGVRPTLVEALPVVTAVEEGDERRLIRLDRQKRYDPVGAEGKWHLEILRRLVLHLSIGGTF